MNKIRLISDIHLEFGPLDLPVMEGEDQQILVIAGDMGLAGKSWTYIPYLKEWSERFQDIIYIMGNHEFYGTSILRAADKIRANIHYEGDMHNVHVVENDIVRINDISFICSTMWASYNKADPFVMNDAQMWMNDHKKIRTGTKKAPYMAKFLPVDAYELFLQSINFIFPNIKAEKEAGQKVCVVTHHGPSYQSVPDRFKTGQFASLNGAYVSDLDEDIIDADPDAWVHGHTHDSFAYEIGQTAVICNPRGYAGHELNPEFNPELIIEFNDE
jgi:predicted phosphodiesterase